MAKLADIDVPEGLIASAREGTESACARLYTALAPSTFGLIRRLVGARAVAEDLFQDTMMTVYERLHDYRGEGPFGAWVRRIAVSKCLMYLRSPWHRARIEIAGSGERLGLGPDDRGEHGSGFGGRYRSGYGGGHEPGELPGPVAPAPFAECLDVERALASLSPTARAVVWLYEVEGYSHQEIAQAFGHTVSFSKSQLARAHRRLREWFEPKDVRQPCTTLIP
ncbi:MAG TPA: RNA polymerase sigma factor [Steroidobacteraceae bacterium]|nr:RNA polymerase sigma factor [Steroidobacteraceae bacterium]